MSSYVNNPLGGQHVSEDAVSLGDAVTGIGLLATDRPRLRTTPVAQRQTNERP